jgi:nucleoid DNA-binding protein
MHSLITSYLIQAGKCSLPGIGFFKIKHNPAQFDVANKQMHPSVEEIIFNEQAIVLSPGLVSYLVHKKNISADEAENLLNKFCSEWKNKIEAGEKLYFEGIGSLQKNDVGIISLTKERLPEYLKSIPAERVFHENAEHPVLVGDKETTSSAMNEYYKEDVPAVKRGWLTGAIILGVITLLILLYSFYDKKISAHSVGNRHNLPVKSANETHFKP